MSINIESGKIIYVGLFLLLGCLMRANCIANEVEENSKIELSIRCFIRDIYNKNYNGILKFVHSDGVVDSNSRISKEKISDDLKKQNSYLYKHLYNDINTDDLILCENKLGGKLIVSPYVFYHKYKENYELKITKLDSKGEYFSVNIVGHNKNITECKFQLWFLTIQKINKSYFLNSYFFN